MKTTGSPDAPVEAAAVQGRRPDFARLYEESFDQIYAFLAHRVETRQEAEDLASEVFHQALASLDRFAWQGTPLIGWVYGIARNVLASYWRRPHRVPAPLSDDLNPETGQAIERQALLSELVASLAPDQRTVIQRRFFDQMSIRQIAAELGRTEGAVKQLQLRALEKLRKKLGACK